MAMRNDGKAEATPGSLLLVIHDFVARSADELSLAKGDRIELIERDDDFGDGWFLGRHLSNGNTGLFPEVYTTPAPKGTLNNAPRRASEGPPKSAELADNTSSTSPTQFRHSASTASTQQRPASAASGQQPTPLAAPAIRTSMASAISPTRTATFNADSPVMNETLSVINEHITDMNTPRSSFGASKRDTIGSVYSTQPLNRFSYIPGHETDEDEHHYHTEDEVMAWSPGRVAEYLEDNGVEKLHCDVFREQEISGEVLLAMDQSSLFIKEFELGPVGRRLKTWHKIKALQDEVKQSMQPEVARSMSEYSAITGAPDDGSGDVVRNRSSTIGTILPRGLSTSSRRSVDAGAGQVNTASLPTPTQTQPANQNTTRGSSVISPLQSMTSMSKAENTYRPSAQTIRTMNHARRHSSMDSTSSANTRQSHRKQPSIDKKWQPGQAAQSNGHAAAAAAAAVTNTEPTLTSANFASTPGTPSSPGDIDRGYFSSNEADSRASRVNKLTKKTSTSAVSPLQSRANSFLFNGRQSTQSAGLTTSGSMRDPVSPIVGPGASPPSLSSAVMSKFGSLRSATTPDLQSKSMTTLRDPSNPVVTKLDYSANPSLNAAMASTPKTQPDSESSSVNATPSPASANLGFFGSQKQKITGLRAISDAVTNKEKTMTSIPVDRSAVPLKDEIGSPTRTGSTTPSTETRSIDMQKSMDGQSRTSTGSAGKLMPPSTSNRRARPKTKKTTSAYTRGLEHKTPSEQIPTCDYSGWMKKKSGSLMSTWKPRLFILKGRRLSYYYRDDDKEEKGLIDISFHRVLPAHNETLTGIHAAVTGAAGIPTSPTSSTTPTNAERDLKANPPKGETDDGLFIFKLVPPKSGLAKGVSFTKPTVHYFAVNSRREGRLWMAALMKATIDRDEDGVVTTTYNQKTISLAKARARKERPPALKEDETEGRAELDGDDASARSVEPSVNNDNSTGLGIGNLMSEKNDSAVGGAEVRDEQKVLLGPALPGEGEAAVPGMMEGPKPAETTAEKEVLTEKEAVASS